ncbi:MAG: hypothetical protein V4717_18050 [Bacteroidota bacterium]
MKKAIFCKTFLALLSLIFITLSSFNVNAQRAGFSGDWKLDEAKSELGEFGGRVARSVKADQKEEAITVVKVMPGFNGGDPITTTVTLTYDGKVAESEGFGGSKRKSTAKWSDDGKTLIINTTMNFERDGQSFEFKSTENWTITKEGLLQVTTNSTSPRGDSTTKAVYSK